MFRCVIVHQTLTCKIHRQRTSGFNGTFSSTNLVSTLAISFQHVDQLVGYLPLFAFFPLLFVLSRARYTTNNIISVIY